MRTAQILEADVLKRVSMTMDGILYENGLMRKNKFSGGSQWKTDAYVAER